MVSLDQYSPPDTNPTAPRYTQINLASYQIITQVWVRILACHGKKAMPSCPHHELRDKQLLICISDQIWQIIL